jgi:hypothetical protein
MIKSTKCKKNNEKENDLAMCKLEYKIDYVIRQITKEVTERRQTTLAEQNAERSTRQS